MCLEPSLAHVDARVCGLNNLNTQHGIIFFLVITVNYGYHTLIEMNLTFEETFYQSTFLWRSDVIPKGRLHRSIISLY